VNDERPILSNEHGDKAVPHDPTPEDVRINEIELLNFGIALLEALLETGLLLDNLRTLFEKS
jgi:hypothetical protein